MIDEPVALPGKPLITFAVIAYNQGEFIREAVEGAFSQTYSPLEIILSDDCSSDGTFEIMREMAHRYKGNHAVILRRNEQNLGVAGHVSAVIEQAKTDIIVLAAGDDISLPERTQRTWELFKENASYGCVSFFIVQFSDRKPDAYDRFAGRREPKEYDIRELETNPLFHTDGAARSIRKSMLKGFPPLMRKTPTEDGPLLFRCLLAGGVAVQSYENLVLYRRHRSSLYSFDNRKSFNYDLLHLQYMSDLSIAFEKGLVDAGELAQIIRNLEKRLEIANTRKGFSVSRNRLVYFASNVLFQKYLPPREKQKMLMTSLAGLIAQLKERVAR